MSERSGTCVMCEERFTYDWLGYKPRILCSEDCRKARAKLQREGLKPSPAKSDCPVCGDSFPPVSGKVYCSKRCRLRSASAYLSRRRHFDKLRGVVKALTCQHCDAAFETTHKRRFCTKTCRVLAYRTVRECEMCQGPVVVAKSNTVTRFCGRRCAAQFTGAQRRDPSAPPRGKGHHARAQQYGCSYEVIDRAAVFSRDGWMCGLCQEPVNPATQWPHPLSASLDHVVPLARGGDHLYSNVQLAHLTCNISKGARHGSTEEATR